MAGPQFIRFQTFAQKSNKGGQSVGQVIDEVERVEQFCQHIETPEPPNQIYGISPREVLALHDAMLEQAKTKVTLKDGRTVERGIRKDRHTLLGCVASHPYTSRMVKDLPDARAEYEEWRQRTVDWLKALYGDKLKCVVEHLDETHPHIHAYILPDDDPDCSARALNPAYVAKERVEAEAKAAGDENKLAVKKGNDAYKEAARAIQDDYAEQVGRFCAMTRTGPKRARLSRQQWKAQKKDAERVRDALTVPERVEAAIALTSATEAPRAPLERVRKDSARRCLEAAPVPLWGDHSASLGPLADHNRRNGRIRDSQLAAMRLPLEYADKEWKEPIVPNDLTIFDAAKWWSDFDRKWVKQAESLIMGQEDCEGLIFWTKTHVRFRSPYVQEGKKPEATTGHISHILEAFRDIREKVWQQLRDLVAPQILMGQKLAEEFNKAQVSHSQPAPRPLSGGNGPSGP